MFSRILKQLDIHWRLFKASYLVSLLFGLIKYQKFGNDNFLEVRPSGEKGEGLFTTKRREAGELIFIATGSSVFAHFTKEDTSDYPNLYCVDEDVWIDVDPPYVKVNHSCTPNTAVDGFRCFISLKEIEEGEELTVDYSTVDDVIGWEMDCHCQSRNCTGKIGSIHTISQERYQHAFPYIPKYIQTIYNQL